MKTGAKIFLGGVFIRYCQICAMVVVVATAISLKGSVLTVTSLADSGVGTLRGQVAASSSGDTIQFAVTGQILLSSTIHISHALDVQGPGPASLTIDGGGVDRAFITAGNPVILSGMTITNGLAMGTNGLDGGTNSMLVDGSPGGNATGGAILDTNSSADVLILSNCWLVGNAAIGGNGGKGVLTFAGSAGGNGGSGGYAWGGAIYFLGQQVTCINCTFSSNRAVGGDGGDGGADTSLGGGNGGSGGGGGEPAGGALTGNQSYCVNCTFSGNSVSGGSGGNGGNSTTGAGGAGGSANQGNDGGAINVAYCFFLSCTIVSNSAFAGTGGTGGTGSPAGAKGASGTAYAGGVWGFTFGGCADTITNTILADNYAQTANTNYFTYWLDGGYNFIGSVDYPVACSFASTTQTGTVAKPIHPLLGPLAQNGGGLPTHATTLTSPVTDQGKSFGLTTDERGAPRPYVFSTIAEPPGGDGSDIGAFELGTSSLGAAVVANTSNIMSISWPAYYGDLTLQSVAHLQGSSWINVTDTPVLIGNRFVVMKPETNSMSFFRLIAQ